MTAITRSRPLLSAAAMVCAVLALCGALLVSPLPGLQGNSAASAQLLEGPGFRIPHDFRLSMVGAYRAPDGSLAYCLEWGQEPPTLASDPAHQSTVVTQYAGWSPEEVARVNWLIGAHGQRVTNEQAAAVGVAIWLRHPGEGDPFRVDHRFFIAAIPDATVRGRVVAEAQRLSRLMDDYRYVAPAPAGSVQVVPDPADAMRGEIAVSGVPLGASGTMTVTGAQFGGAASPGASPSPVTTAAIVGDVRLPYRLTPSDAEIGSAEVTVSAELTLPGGSAGPALRVWQSAPALQDVAAVGPVESDFRWQLRASEAHSLVFSPRFSTQVPSRILAEGEPLADAVSLSLAPGSAPWRRFTDGSTLPMTLVCHAYGPFEAPPRESADVPADAPLATAPVRVQVGGSSGDPLAEVASFEYALTPSGGGYYVSVCGIDASDQDDARSAAGLPVGYRYADAFGLLPETQFAPVGVRFDTTLSDAQVHPGASVVDVIVGEPTDGPWAEWERARVAVPLVGTVYWSETRPVRAAEAPGGAAAVMTLRAELTGPGERAEVVIDLPDRAGWYTVRWCTDPAGTAVEGERPLVRAWCDDYGIPSETVHAAPPVPRVSLGLAVTGAGGGAVPGWAGWLATLGGVLVLSAGLSLPARRRFARRGSARASSPEQ